MPAAMKVCTLFIGLGVLLGSDAKAQVDPRLAGDLLAVMDRHVQERKLAKVPTARLTDLSINTLMLTRRFYRQGDEWVVTFLPASDPSVAAMARMIPIDSVGQVDTRPAIYDYRVTAVVDRGALISVRQRVADGEQRADERVDHYVLEMDRRFVPVRKEIHYRDGRVPLSLSYDPRGPMSVGFEAAPLDLPDITKDDGTPTRDASGRPALEFHINDIYARPVMVIWSETQPWPSLVKTVAGTAVLSQSAVRAESGVVR